MSKKRYKIGIIVYDLYINGGTQREALESAKELENRGHKVKIYAFNFNPENCYPELSSKVKIKYLSLKKPRIFTFQSLWLRIPYFFIKLILTYWKAWKLSLLIDADTDIVNPHFYSLEAAYFFKLRHPKIKIVWLSLEAPGAESNIKLIKAGKASLIRRLHVRFEILRYQLMVKKVNAITVNDNREKLLHSEIFNRDVIIVHSGVDVGQFRPPNRKKGNNFLKILLIGVLFPSRRFEDAILALKIVKEHGYNSTLTIVGNDLIRPDYNIFLRNLISKNGLDGDIVFLREVDDESLVGLYQKSDVFIWPCDGNTYGLVALEAMACGLPVIVSDAAGVAGDLSEGKGAFIIPVRRPDLIAQKLIFLILNPNIRKDMGLKARKFIENYMSWQKFTDRMENVFDVMLNN